MFNSKVFVAELIGTFALVFIGAGAGVVGAGLVGVALAHGLTIVVFVYAFGHISGTHINPAVTFGLALQGVVKWAEAVVSYWIPQFLGAALAAFFLHTIVTAVGGDISGGTTIGALTETAPIYATLVEALLTFFLVNTILHTAVGGNGGQFAGLAIGLTLTAVILVGGPFTGASLNPARTFGPAIFSGPSFTNVYTYIIYLFGPLFGSTIAVMAYQFFTEEKAGAIEEVEEEPEKTPLTPKTTTTRKAPVPKTTARKTTKS
jgi:MIP family channel proteins